MKVSQLLPSLEWCRDFWQQHRILLLRWLAVSGILAALVWSLWAAWAAPTRLRIAVGPESSQRASFIRAVAKSLEDRSHNVQLRVVPVADSAAAAKLLADGKVHLAVVRSDDGETKDVRAVAIIDRRVALLVGRAEPKPVSERTQSPADNAQSPADKAQPSTDKAQTSTEKALPAAERPTPSSDGEEAELPAAKHLLKKLAGAKIVVGNDALGSNQALFVRLLSHTGLDGRIGWLERPLEEVGDALAKDEAQLAAIVVDPIAGASRRLLADMTRKVGGPLVVHAVPYAEALVQISRDLVAVELAPGQLGGAEAMPAAKLTASAITEEIVADSDLADSTVTELAKGLTETRGRLTAQARGDFELEVPPTDKLRRFMPHAGVVAYINDKAQTFLEKYSEQLWLGLFALGLLGSSVAGLASWLGLGRNQTVDPALAEMQRLLGTLDQIDRPSEVTALRAELRRLAGARVLDGAGASDGADVAAWYTLADQLAARRLEEITSRSVAAAAPATGTRAAE